MPTTSEKNLQAEYTATYSPEDNKLRLYSLHRLDTETYSRLKAAGFKWAPKQQLFVAPMWTPGRYDLLVELCGEVGDEDTSLVERQQERADRFEGYSENRLQDAHAAKAAVDAIADHIPFGQPILVGHHSERHARKHAQKIENGMRKAVKMWETSQYWKDRAVGALCHAQYKESPRVRANRIRTIEADRRKATRERDEFRARFNSWLNPTVPFNLSSAMAITAGSYSAFKFPLDRYPREAPKSQYEGEMSLYRALEEGIITPRQARNLHVPVLVRTIKNRERWIAHYENRLIYERAMLEEQGASDLLKPKERPKQLPLLNYRQPEGFMIENIYRKGESSLYPQVEMTKAEFAKIYQDYKGTRIVENSHRVRFAVLQNHKRAIIFLTDSKVHEKPEPVVKPEPKPLAIAMQINSSPDYPTRERTQFDDMKNTLKNGGVQIVSAPQLFPTPPELARRMAREAGILAGRRILEPSAGTGNLVSAAINAASGADCCRIVAVEINAALVGELRNMRDKTLYANGHNFEIKHADFLDCNGDLLKFDRIIMNPPFENGADIKHIKHAMSFLKEGGRLVALCANGPRQRDQLKPIAEESGGFWEDLPAGTFKNAGTNVNTALLVIEN